MERDSYGRANADVSQTGLVVCEKQLTELVIGSAIDVHRELGPGLLESAYESALVYELTQKDLICQRQIEVPLLYKGVELGQGFRADVIVEDSLLLELKAVDALTNLHTAQVITYLKLLKIKRGLLINFNTGLLKNGIKRISI